VELEPDELPGDNVRHFAVWIGPAPGIDVSAAAGPFVRSGVDVLKGGGRVTDGRDIAVVPADELSSLPALILAPADPVRIGAANRALERAGVPWRFGLSHRGEATITAANGAEVARPRANPPDAGGSDSVRAAAFTDVSATVRYDLVAQPGADADTLARVGRDPWVVAGPRYVLIASPMDPAATTFPVRAAFVPWLAEVLTERLVGEPGGVVAAAPGRSLPRPRWADAMEGPSGARAVLGDDFQVPALPGTYFLDRGGRRVGAVVVNPDPSESVLDRMGAAEIGRRISAQRVLIAPNRPQFAAMSFRAAAQRSILEPLVIAALALLVIEAVMVRVGRRAAA
jgi:hypothetical protein